MRKICWTIIGLLLALSATAAEWGRLSGQAPEVGAPGPKKTSRYFVVEGTIRQGQATLELPLDSPEGALMMVVGAHASRVTMDQDAKVKARRYVTPDLSLMDMPETGTRIEVGPVTPGWHRLQLSTEVPDGPVRLVVAQPDSPLTLSVQLRPLAAHPGDIVTVSARFPDALGTATAQAVLESGERIQLLDDGTGGDPVAGDGVYTGQFVAPAVTGPGLNVRVDAEGESANGAPFRRTALAAVMVSEPTTGLLGPVQGDFTGLGMTLKPATGRYRVEALYVRGDRLVAFSRETVALDGTSRDVSLPRPAFARTADRAVVRVLNMDTMGLEAETVVKLPELDEPRPGKTEADSR